MLFRNYTEKKYDIGCHSNPEPGYQWFSSIFHSVHIPQTYCNMFKEKTSTITFFRVKLMMKLEFNSIFLVEKHVNLTIYFNIWPSKWPLTIRIVYQNKLSQQLTYIKMKTVQKSMKVFLRYIKNCYFGTIRKKMTSVAIATQSMVINDF